MTDIVLSHRPAPPADLDAFAGDLAVRRLIVRGGVVVGAFFVLLGGWAAVARLDSGAVAYGVVQSEDSRSVVQHPDGGVVAAVLVREGDLVRKGQELVRLDQVQAKAAAEITSASADALTAVVARLEAEQSGAGRISFPKSLTSRAGDPSVAEVMATQVKLFDARGADLSGAGGALSQQIGVARSQAAGYASEIAALDKQYDLIQEELSGLKKLYDQGYATKPRLLAMERAAAAIIGQKHDYQSNIDRLGYTSSQVEQQVAQLRRDRMSNVSEQLGEARAKLADALERQGAARQLLDRTVIRAPADGHVLGLTAKVGTVIGRGEAILQVIPNDGAATVEARLKPNEGAHVKSGMKVQLRVMSADGRTMPMLHGVIRSRSADLLSDPRSGAGFYTIKVKVEEADAARVRQAGLGVGTPMQVVVPTGSRTALQYIFEPVADSFRRGLKER